LPPVATPLTAVAGRVLRGDVRAPEDLPAFARSAMDGYALALDDDSPRFRVVGEIQPGVVPKIQIGRGECARIFTGAQIPAGATQVLMQEYVRVEGDFIVPTQRTRVTHIRARGEDARRGDLLLAAGARLGAGELALLASLGVTQPLVSPAVRVAHITTGNELVDPAQTPSPGQIRDSNSTLVAALVQQFGGILARQERVTDDFELLLARARVAADGCDLLLVSGGASVGDYDFGSRLLRALGFQIHFERISLRPGKPLVFATRGGQAAFILPGNPVSHFVTLHVAVRLAMEQFSGSAPMWPEAEARLAEDFAYRPDARETFWPASVRIENGRLVARARRWQSSGDVTGLTGVNALLQFAAGAPQPKVGDSVSALLLELP
ncbi:MAG: molybdopterin molybdotransferase MoeA, partial [Verrucomicrobia bacterium]|nr:molybdopterin molybdotransferase MoeA [Verrucomicrobiota bacterium]